MKNDPIIYIVLLLYFRVKGDFYLKTKGDSPFGISDTES